MQLNNRVFPSRNSLTIIPLVLVGYEMIIAYALRASLAIIISYPTLARGIIVNYMHGRAYVT